MPYHPITPAEVRTLLDSDPPHTAKLATVRPDGRAHVVPIWFVTDDDGTILFNTGADTVKGANPRRAGRAAICVDDEAPPYSFVMIEGTVDLVEDLDEVRSTAGRIGARYMGAARAEEFAARNGVPGELLVRLHPDSVAGAADMAD